MSPYRFLALETRDVEELRLAKRSSGLAIRRQIVGAGDRAPCRHCLKDAQPGEEVILASISPFSGNGPYNERGPVFVHAKDCPRHQPASAIPEIVRTRLVAIRAYCADETIIDADVVEGREAGSLIERLLSQGGAAFLHVRTARFGCYLCRVERAA